MQTGADPANGYEQHAAEFLSRRSSEIGAATVRQWTRKLAQGAAVLDVGCGCGVPITAALVGEGFAVSALDASPTLVAAFEEQFPDVPVVCERIEDSPFFGRTFDGIVCWGLMFLLPAESQQLLIQKAARALGRGGQFLFTAPKQVCAWHDNLTGRESRSLGFGEYWRLLQAEGFTWEGDAIDEGGNYYYFATKE